MDCSGEKNGNGVMRHVHKVLMGFYSEKVMDAVSSAWSASPAVKVILFPRILCAFSEKMNTKMTNLSEVC